MLCCSDYYSQLWNGPFMGEVNSNRNVQTFTSQSDRGQLREVLLTRGFKCICLTWKLLIAGEVVAYDRWSQLEVWLVGLYLQVGHVADSKSQNNWAMEWWNDGTTKRRKMPQNHERRNNGKALEILRDGMRENSRGRVVMPRESQTRICRAQVSCDASSLYSR